MDCNSMKELQVIIWGGISMTPKCAFEAEARLLQGSNGNKEPFGDKTLTVSDEFRQILPVVGHGIRTVEERLQYRRVSC